LSSKWNSKNILILVIAVSILLRLAAAFYLGNSVQILPGTYDQVSYHNLAIRLLGGHGFTFDTFWWPATRAGAQTAHWSYLYTFYLVLVYGIFGPSPLAARLIQAVIVGILHPLLVYLIGRKVFNETVGLLAAGVTAVYVYFVYYSATLMTEPFYISAILASLYLAILLARPAEQNASNPHRRDLKLGVLLGLAFGAAILLRQLFMLIVPFIVLWIGFARWRQKSGIPLGSLALSVGVIAALILPFTAFNYARFNRFVILNTNAGFAFFWGNHPIQGTHFYAILPPNLPSYQELIPQKYRSLDEAALDSALLKEGIKFVVDDPVRYVLLSINRIKDYFVFWPTADSGFISNLSRLLSFTLFLPFMIYGILLALFSRKWVPKLSLDSPVAMLLLYALLYTTVHLLTWTLIRYRLPVDAVLLIFASLGLVDLVERIWAARHKSKSMASSQDKGLSSL
jgi:4-amino-4-deoxy-L-arabinose transferase-like glycosyltransferase